MKLVLDMNLPPAWVPLLEGRGHDAVHWAAVGDPRASDATIIAWALDEDRVVVTSDLDFGAILAATQLDGPSVVQVRPGDLLSEALALRLADCLEEFGSALETGAILSLDHERARVRLLPFPQAE